MSEDWLTLLRARVAEIGVNATARELGISGTSVSTLITERYPADTRRMAARIIDRYTRHECPYDGALLHGDACARYAGKMPTSSPAALRRWRTCQTCEFNPNRKG